MPSAPVAGAERMMMALFQPGAGLAGLIQPPAEIFGPLAGLIALGLFCL